MESGVMGDIKGSQGGLQLSKVPALNTSLSLLRDSHQVFSGEDIYGRTWYSLDRFINRVTLPGALKSSAFSISTYETGMPLPTYLQAILSNSDKM